jgi:acylphosphatase
MPGVRLARAGGGAGATMPIKARSRGVSGWVRNCPDGSVEALFEGDADAVDAMLAFTREGPRGAEVERVDVEDVAPEGLDDFQIR